MNKDCKNSIRLPDAGKTTAFGTLLISPLRLSHYPGPPKDGHEVLRNEIRETRTALKHEIELCNFKIDAVATDLKATDKRLSGKIDAVAADLKAHRADTEAHHGVYRV